MTQFNGISIDRLWDVDQWSYIRKNIGEWRGSFIQFSPTADQMSETPSVLTLEEDHPDQHMTLVLKRTPQGKNTHTLERDLGYGVSSGSGTSEEVPKSDRRRDYQSDDLPTPSVVLEDG